MKHWVVAALVLTGLCFAVYYRVLNADFNNFDDDVYVTANPLVRSGLSLHNLFVAFSRPLSSFYIPMTQLSFMVDSSIWGMEPFGFHLTNLVLHAVNAILLLLVLVRMTGAWWRSVAASALFAMHPLRVESVAWVTERKDLLSGLFFLLTLLAWQTWLRRRGNGRQTVVLFWFALALMSKQMVVTLPVLLLLLDWWPLARHPAAPGAVPPTDAGRTAWGLVGEKGLLVALALGFGILTLIVGFDKGSAIGFDELPLGARMANAAVSYVRYLGFFVWPACLSIFYTHPGAAGPPTWQVISAGLALVGLTAFTIWQARRWPWLAVGWFWFCIGMAPVSGLAQSGSHAMADRFTYLPSIGLGVAVVWQGWALIERFLPTRVTRPLAATLMTLWLVGLGLVSWQQTVHWRDSETVFDQALACGQDHYFVRTNLGQALIAKGEYARAEPHLLKALELNPKSARAANNLGLVAANRGDLDRARAWFERAIAARPSYADAYNNLAIALYRQGQYQAAWMRVDECLRLGGRPHPEFLRALARAMPPPPRVRSFFEARRERRGQATKPLTHKANSL